MGGGDFLKKWYAQQKVKHTLTQHASCPEPDALYKLFSAMDNLEFVDEITYR
jgi:hypothetical protein